MRRVSTLVLCGVLLAVAGVRGLGAQGKQDGISRPCAQQSAGRGSSYDAEINALEFSNGKTVGRDVQDARASRGWARCAATGEDPSGYIVRGLKTHWKSEQNVERPGGAFDPLTFLADFYLRCPEDKGVGGKFTVARLEAHAILTDSSDSLLAQRNLTYSELEDSGAVGPTYRPFRLRFTLSNGAESRIQAFDYRVYWTGRVDLYADKVTVWHSVLGGSARDERERWSSHPFTPAQTLHTTGSDVYTLAVFYGHHDNDRFGYQVAGLGDLNGDGYADFSISADFEHKVYVYFGGCKIHTVPDLTFSSSDLTWEMRSGDWNADGALDLVTADLDYNRERGRVYIYWGGADLDTIPDVVLEAPPSCTRYFGWSLNTGDINGDGIDDLLVGGENHLGGPASIYVYYGARDFPTEPSFVWAGSVGDYYFNRLRSGGDWNGDGYDDVVVTFVPFRTAIYLGGDPPAPAPAFTVWSGGSVALSPEWAMGDVNGDGYDDLCHAYCGVLLGGPEPDTLADILFQPRQERGVAVTGHFNRDRFADVLIGTPAYGNWTGAIWFFPGGSPMRPRYTWAVGGPDWGAFGDPIDDVGDVDGNGVEDFLVGEPEYPALRDRGRVFLLTTDTTSASRVSAGRDGCVPSSPRLFPPYPNPFNGRLVVRYTVPRREWVRLWVSDVLGREVAALVEGWKTTGSHRFVWHGQDSWGNPVPSGVYLVHLAVGETHRVQKVVLVR